MAILEILVCMLIIVMQFPVIPPERELGLMCVVSNIGVSNGIKEFN